MMVFQLGELGNQTTNPSSVAKIYLMLRSLKVNESVKQRYEEAGDAADRSRVVRSCCAR